MASDLIGKKYKDMSEEYRNSTSKADFKAERKSQNRMAGDALSDEKVKSVLTDAPQVTDINDYDTTAFGKGSGAGGDRLSRRDLLALEAQGFSRQEIIDYSEEKVGDPTVGTKQGDKARNLLDKWKKSINDGEVPEPEPTPTPTPTSGGPINVIIDNPDPTEPPFWEDDDFKPGTGGGNMYQNIYQDNDINTQVYGNNNNITNTQDNSIRQIGGNYKLYLPDTGLSI